MLDKPAVHLHLLIGKGKETQSRGKLIIENCPGCPDLALFIKNWLKSGGLARWGEWLTVHTCDLISMLGAHVRKLAEQVSICSPNIPMRKWADKSLESNIPMVKWEAGWRAQKASPGSSGANSPGVCHAAAETKETLPQQGGWWELTLPPRCRLTFTWML